MKFKLFAVNCKNEECGHELVTNSLEITSCPSCGGDIAYSDDYITAISDEIFSSDVKSLVDDKETALAGILIALSYINGHDTIARYDDNCGFRLNIKKSEYTDKILNKLGISSIPQLQDLIEENMDEHESLIIDPVFECIERSYYYDEDDNLYERGYVASSTAKKFYDWILANTDYITDILK